MYKTDYDATKNTARPKELLLREEEFWALLDLIMCSDPWPIDDKSRSTLLDCVNRISVFLGYKDWAEAYHEFGIKLNERRNDHGERSK